MLIALISNPSFRRQINPKKAVFYESLSPTRVCRCIQYLWLYQITTQQSIELCDVSLLILNLISWSDKNIVCLLFFRSVHQYVVVSQGPGNNSQFPVSFLFFIFSFELILLLLRLAKCILVNFFDECFVITSLFTL